MPDDYDRFSFADRRRADHAEHEARSRRAELGGARPEEAGTNETRTVRMDRHDSPESVARFPEYAPHLQPTVKSARRTAAPGYRANPLSRSTRIINDGGGELAVIGDWPQPERRIPGGHS
jgi:hypothetical protein